MAIEIVGRQEIAGDPAKVWDLLLDPDVLRVCIPGCRELTKETDTVFHAVVIVKIGPVKAKFSGKVTLSDIASPLSCRLSGVGEGGIAGFAKGHADIALSPLGNGTIMDYRAEAAIGGKLAQLGSRLVQGATRKLIEEFFIKFRDFAGQPLAT